MRHISRTFPGSGFSHARRFSVVYAIAALAIILALSVVRLIPPTPAASVEIADTRYDPDNIFISVDPIGLKIQSDEEMVPFSMGMIDSVLANRQIPGPSHVDVVVYWRLGASSARVFEVLEDLKGRGFTRIQLNAEPD